MKICDVYSSIQIYVLFRWDVRNLIMKIEEVRGIIDEIDLQVRDLLMKRLNCSKMIAESKVADGGKDVFQPEREKFILTHLSDSVPQECRNLYVAVMKRILETSRMYQYHIISEVLDCELNKLPESVDFCLGGSGSIHIQLSLENNMFSLSHVLSIIEDYEFSVEYLQLLSNNEAVSVYEITITGNFEGTSLKKLLLQLAKENKSLKIVEAI